MSAAGGQKAEQKDRIHMHLVLTLNMHVAVANVAAGLHRGTRSCFAGFAQRFVAQLHKDGQKWVPIVNPGIKVEPGYVPYDEGMANDVFLKAASGSPYLGQVRQLTQKCIALYMLTQGSQLAVGWCK